MPISNQSKQDLPWIIDIDCFSIPKSMIGWDSYDAAINAIRCGQCSSSSELNNEITWDIVLNAGIWSIELMFYRDTSQGICNIQFDGITKGIIDCYGTEELYNERGFVTGIIVPLTKKIELKLIMASKNINSTAYNCNLSGIRLMRTA